MAETKAQTVNDYQAQDDVHTLMRAHQIRKDPKRHKAAKAHAKKQLDALKAIGGVREMGDSTVGAPGDQGNPY